MEYEDDYSSYGNEVLYRMCAEKPLHTSIDVIKSKLWLIGRSYSASIERRAGKDFKIKDAARIIKESSIDEKIKKVSQIERPDIHNLPEILELHSYFVDLLKESTGIAKRSLASKYLHFHAPRAIFIYDSIANTNLRSKLQGERFKTLKGFDNAYASFCLRAIKYRDDFEVRINALLTPRRLDAYLLNYENNL